MTMLVLTLVINYALLFTPWGLRTRSVGEHPKAADTVGINVFRTRYTAVIIGGMIAALEIARYSSAEIFCCSSPIGKLKNISIIECHFLLPVIVHLHYLREPVLDRLDPAAMGGLPAIIRGR